MSKPFAFKPISAEHALRVPFYDVDPMHIVWHGNYVKYFEDGRCALLDKIDYNYTKMGQSGFSYPVIDLRIQYAKPLTFGQEIVVQATLKDIDFGLLIGYKIFDKATGQRLSKGYTRQVPVSLETQEMFYGSPDVLFDCIRAFNDKQP